MPADFTTPAVTQTEANYAQAIRDLFVALALGLDTTVSNTPTGAIRWSGANSRWEKYNGTSWAALVSKYLIDVDTLDGKHASDFALTGHDHASVYQPLDAELTALAGLVSAADKAPYFTGSGAAALMTVTSAARTLLDDTTVAAMRTTLGLVIGTNVQAQNANLAALAGLTLAANKLAYATGSGALSLCDLSAFGRSLIAAADAGAARTALGVGSGAMDLTVFHAFLAQLSAGRSSGAMPGGYMWLFSTDELATKTNATYVSASKLYANAGTLSGTKTTLSAGQLSASGVTSFSADQMINGTTAASEGGYVPNGTAAGVFVQIDFGAGNSKPLGKWRTYANAQVSNGSWKAQYSDDGSAWTDAGSGTVDFAWGAWTDLTWAFAGSHRYWRIVTTASASGQGWLSEIEVYEFGSATNMTLIPAGISAGSSPKIVDLYLLHKAVDAITLGTDLKARVTLDGTNWSSFGTLEDLGQFDASNKLLHTRIDTSALTGTTGIKWEVTTLNSKSQQLRAAAMLLS